MGHQFELERPEAMDLLSRISTPGRSLEKRQFMKLLPAMLQSTN